MEWSDTLPWGILFAGAALLWGRLLLGLCRDRLNRASEPPAAIRRAQLIIPCMDHDDLAANLDRFASQDHPDWQLTLVTASEAEPAAAVCRRIAARVPHCEHVIAGVARKRGQKNHNLIAAVRAGRSRSPEVLVFCDDDCAPPDQGWLARFSGLAAASPDRVITTFRKVVPGRRSPASYLYYCSTGFQRSAVAATSRFVWGGGVAIGADTFDALGVEQAWSSTVVDDVVLAALCADLAVRIDYAPSCLLDERCAGEGLRSGFCWLVRQLQFLRYHALSALMALFAQLGVTLLAATYLAHQALFGAAGSQAVTAVAAVCTLSAAGFAAGVACAHGGPRRPWDVLACVLAGGALVFVGLFAVLRALSSTRVTWRDRAYVMARDGRVLRVEQR